MGYSLQPDIRRFPRPSKPHTRLRQVSEAGLRFYNPGLGRWLSRDPIGERGGINAYACLVNDAINQVDAFGLESFTVRKCEAVLYVGHQSEKKPHQWKADECSAAGGVGCWPRSNNLAEDDSRRWPDVPTHNVGVIGGPIGRNIGRNRGDFENAYADRDPGDPRGERDFDKMVENALSDDAKKKIMDRLCKTCCTTVTFIYKIGKDKGAGGKPIEQAVAPHGFSPGKTYTKNEPCPTPAH